MKLDNISIRISSLNNVDQGIIIKEARKAKGLTQTQLAELINNYVAAEPVDVKKVSKWETGKINKIEPEYKEAIYNILDLNPSNFCTYSLQLYDSEKYIDYVEVQDAIEFLDFVINKNTSPKIHILTVNDFNNKSKEHLDYTKSTIRENLYQFIKHKENLIETSR